QTDRAAHEPRRLARSLPVAYARRPRRLRRPRAERGRLQQPAARGGCAGGARRVRSCAQAAERALGRAGGRDRRRLARRPCRRAPAADGRPQAGADQGGSVKLYSYFRSSAAYRTRIALNLKGLAYQTVSIHLTKEGGKQFGAAYKAVNPQMRVPALELASGEVLLQSLAIIDYLDETHPQP